MATTTIFRNFTVADGTVINAPSNGRASYVLYKTSMYMADLQSSVPTLIRSYLHPGATPLINNTSIFLYRKICTPVGQSYMIEAINMFQYPGNPGDAMYGEVPTFAPRVCILRHVAGNVETTYDGRQIFKIQSAAWSETNFRQLASCEVTFENTIHWKKTSPLNAGTAVYLIGHLLGRHENNLPLLNIKDITFYAGSRPDSSGVTGQRVATTTTHLSATNGWETSNLKAKQHAGTFSNPITLSSDSSDGQSSNSNSPEVLPVSSHTGARSNESSGQHVDSLPAVSQTPIHGHPTPPAQPTSPAGPPTNPNTGQSFQALTHATPNGHVGPPPVPHPAPAQQLNPSITQIPQVFNPGSGCSQQVNSNTTPHPFTHSLTGPFISHRVHNSQSPNTMIRTPANAAPQQFRMTVQPLQVAYPSLQPIVPSQPEAMNNPMPFTPSIDSQKELELISCGIQEQKRQYAVQHREIPHVEGSKSNGNSMDESTEVFRIS
ncbi:hypothetical protein M422DRAFT_253785 [Sphaerobolus stellatus SS14]|uniref:Uncharacterized protein n=1 Tax=Sphaerobolus stellatus (strain SS14) TaxID=990650 RepID=A0A0C9VW88_SPHS4|nr:hypothetical protein M422DRAFT_253785 [Sphaerobolus stellatus SS14]